MTAPEPRDPEPPVEWLGHRDLCALQWGEDCDCDEGSTFRPPCSCPGLGVNPDCLLHGKDD